MTVEVTAEELELILLALKEQVRQRRAAGQQSTEHESLIARLELTERDFRRAAGRNP